MDVFPDFDGLGGIGDLRAVIGALLTFVLIVAVLMLIVSAIVWAIAAANGNHAIASKGRTGVLVALGAAVLAGGGVAWMNWLIALGDQLSTPRTPPPSSIVAPRMPSRPAGVGRHPSVAPLGGRTRTRGGGAHLMREPRPCSPPSLAGCSCQEPIVFDLATTVLAAPLVVPMDINIDPNSDGLPGIAQLRTIVGAVMTVGLILSVLALIISAIMWASAPTPPTPTSRGGARSASSSPAAPR